MAKKKQQLVLANDVDFMLFGIVCHSKDYRLCFELNKALHTEFIRTDDLEMKNKKGEVSFYSVYTCMNEDKNQLYVISNKSENDFLVPELKQWDFFFMIKGFMRDQDKAGLAESIKNTKLVVLIHELDTSQIKSIQNLIF